MADGSKPCKLVLSSTPTLDLYKANTAQCQSKSLQEVNAWQLRDETIVLYARGKVVVRLAGDGTSFSGTLDDQGAPVTLSR